MKRILLIVLLLCSSWSSLAHAGFMDWIDENMIDPEDGQFDMSNYLASAQGFLPVPIIITEPAVGFGLGAIERINTSTRNADYRGYYGPADADIVRRICAGDIERFEYEF